MANNPNHDEEPQAIDAEHSENTPLPGNRPADNALRATAESDLNLSWHGGEGAADFLGLDQEACRPAEPVSIELDTEPQESTDQYHVEQPSIPLHSPEYEQPAGQLEMAPAYAAPEPEAFEPEAQEFVAESPVLEDEAATDDSNWLLDTGEGVPEEAGEPSFEDAAALELEVAEALDSSFSEASSSRSPMRMVLMASLVVLAAGGTWYFSQGTAVEQPVQVASLDTPAVLTQSSAGSAEASAEGATSSVATTAEDAELIGELAELITGSESGEVAVSAPTTTTTEVLVEAGDSTIAEVAEPPVPAENIEDRAERVVQINTGEMVLLPNYSSSLRLASESELGMLWSEATIPFEKFGAEKRVLTPNVGRVRVVISGDEIFEGRLYAVGEGNVWIDSKIGRVALKTASVHDVQQISGDERTPELGGHGSQKLAGLPRVRVKGAGGNFYGKVVAREGNLVTLIPDTGGRIRLQSSEVEVVGTMRTSLVRAELE